MSTSDLKQGKANWLAPWVSTIIWVVTVIYMVGTQASTLADVKADVDVLKPLASNFSTELAALKDRDPVGRREFDTISRRLDTIERKLDRVLEQYPVRRR